MPVPPFFPFWGCLRRLRWTDAGDHLRAPIRLPMVSVLTPPHQSPFRIKASGAAPERRSSPGPWRTAPQQIVGTLPCPCGLQVKRAHVLHHADLVTDEGAPLLRGHACASSRQRRWRQTPRSNAAEIAPEGGVANQNVRLTTNAVYELTPPAVWSGPLEAKGFGPFKGHLIAYDVIAGPC